MKRLVFMLLLVFRLASTISAQDLSATVPLSPENASRIELIRQIGLGEAGNIVWSPLGDIFALPTRNRVFIYSTSDFTRPIDSLEMRGATVWSPDGRFLASSSGDIWDFAENRLRGNFLSCCLSIYEYASARISFDPTSHYIFAATGTDIRIWNVYGVGPQDPLRGDFATVQISPNGQYLVGRNSLDSDLSEFYVWSLPERQVLYQFQLEGNYETSTILNDKQTIVSIESESIKWFNLETGEEIFSYVSILDRPDDTILSTDAQSLYVLAEHGQGMAISKIDLDESGFPTEETIIYEQLGTPNWGLGADLGTMSLSPDGRYLSVQTSFQGLALINLESQQREYYFLEHMEYVRSVRLSPDNRYLAVGNGRANLNIWNLETGQVDAALFGDVENTEGLIFEGDDIYLVQMDYDGEALKLWNLREKQLLGQLTISPHLAQAFAFNSQTRQALAVTANGIASLWQLNLEEASFQEIAQFDTTCSEGVYDTAMSGNGQRFIVSGDDCTSIWDIASQELLERSQSGYYTVAMNYEGNIWLHDNGYIMVCFSYVDSDDGNCVNPTREWYDGFWGFAINPTDELEVGILRFGDAYLVDMTSDEQLAELGASGAAVTFSEDNRLLVLGTNSGYVNIYGVLAGE